MSSFYNATAYVYTFDTATGTLTSDLMRIPGGCGDRRSPPLPSATPLSALKTLGKDTHGFIDEVHIRRGEFVYFVEQSACKTVGHAPTGTASEDDSEKENVGEGSRRRARAVRKAMREVRKVELLARQLEGALTCTESEETAGADSAGRRSEVEVDRDDEDDDQDDEEDDEEDDDDGSDQDDDDESTISEDGSDEEEDCDDDECEEGNEAVKDRAVELFGDEEDWEVALFGRDEDEADHMDATIEDIKQDHNEAELLKMDAEKQTDASESLHQSTSPRGLQAPAIPLPSAEVDIIGCEFQEKTAITAGKYGADDTDTCRHSLIASIGTKAQQSSTRREGTEAKRVADHTRADQDQDQNRGTTWDMDRSADEDHSTD